MNDLRAPAYEKLEMLIDGEWCQGSEGKTEDVLNPATEQVLGKLPHASQKDLDRALAAAHRGFETWRKVTAHERSKIMRKAVDLIRERSESIATSLTLEEGKPLAQARLEVGATADIIEWYAEEGKRAYGRVVPARLSNVRQTVLREPIGPCAAFTPWNFPCAQPGHKVGGALGAGCSLILKASEETPGGAIAIGRALQDAGLPAGVLNIVFGVPNEVSTHLIASRIVKKVSFTGSTPVGKHLAKLAAEGMKKVTMELGGHAPVLVFDDVDPVRTAEILAASKYRNAGQVCASPTRFYIQERVYDKFVERFNACVSVIKLGNGIEAGTEMGPLANSRRVVAMEALVADAVRRGAKLETGGKRVGNQGYFFEPTVLTGVSDEAEIMNKEPFGPIVAIAPFKSFDEVIARANRLDYGLAAYAFTSSSKTAIQVSDALSSGMVGVNHLGISTPETPFGGIKESGFGQEGGIEGLDAYLVSKFVSMMGV